MSLAPLKLQVLADVKFGMKKLEAKKILRTQKAML